MHLKSIAFKAKQSPVKEGYEIVCFVIMIIFAKWKHLNHWDVKTNYIEKALFMYVQFANAKYSLCIK